jgi:hypothetical protein
MVLHDCFTTGRDEQGTIIMGFDEDTTAHSGGSFEVVTLGQLNRKLRLHPKSRKELSFDLSRMPRSDLEKLLVVSGKVGTEDVAAIRTKCTEIGCDFVNDLRGCSLTRQY